MDAFLISLNIVLPLLIMGLVGFAVKRLTGLDGAVFAGINRLVCDVCLPALLFVCVYNCDFAAFSGSGIIFIVAVILIDFALFFVIVPLIVKSPSDRGVLIHALFRGNTALYGIPVAKGILGDGDISTVAVACVVIIIIYNVLAPITLSVCGVAKSSPAKVIKKVATTPILIAGVVGFLLAQLGVVIPAPIMSAAESLSDLATPLAFIVLGAMLTFDFTRDHLKILAGFLAVRLVVTPVIWIAVAAGIFGFRGADIVALLVTVATPTAVSTYPLAQAYALNHKLASELVVSSTAFSIVTLMLFITAFKALGLA